MLYTVNLVERNYLKKKKIKLVRSSYIKTNKNDQVKNFYKECSFVLEKNENSNKRHPPITFNKLKAMAYAT
mgnify:CR=1 FL=1